MIERYIKQGLFVVETLQKGLKLKAARFEYLLTYFNREKEIYKEHLKKQSTQEAK
jgi:hypothetical protein